MNYAKSRRDAYRIAGDNPFQMLFKRGGTEFRKKPHDLDLELSSRIYVLAN